MNPAESSLEALREAIRLSPNNTPLRLALGNALLGLGRAAEALEEFRVADRSDPDEPRAKLGVATCYLQLGKHTHAITVVEELLKLDDTPAQAYVLHARLLAGAGEIERAVRQYKRGVDADPTAADEALESRLGIGADEDSEVVDGRLRATADHDESSSDTRIERPEVNFSHVGGMDAIKDEIRMKIIHPLEHPEIYAAYGKKVGGGILMYGPPGCGKTHLARATAGQVNAQFLAIGISDVLDMWIGQSERNLHELFESARRNRPCVMFFDEVDALGASRSDMRQSAGRHLINQFLAELDGVQQSNEGVLILAATNAPWHLDAAFRRPGRFDRVLFVPPPDQPARAAILRVLLRDKPVQNIDHDQVAVKTDAFSGADLKAVVDTAVESKLREAIRLSRPTPLTTRDLLAAAKTLKPTTREWFNTARNYALYANQGGAYDDVLQYLKLK